MSIHTNKLMPIRTLRFALPFAVILALTALITSLDAQVVIRKSAWSGNPSLHFKGVSGNPALSQAVLSNLKNCGWFDLTSDAGANYTLAATDSGASVAVVVQGQESFSMSVPARQTPRETANTLVDAVLRRCFKIRGICSSRIVFCVELKRGFKELYVSDFDGANIERVTNNNNLSVEPEWTPNGSSIYYTCYGRGLTDIVEYHVASKRNRRIAQFPGLNAGAAISPNGGVIAMILSKDKKLDLYIKALSGTSLRRLTDNTAVEASPCWSPDGRQLCFVSNIGGGNPQLYIIGSGGGATRRVPTIGQEAVTPSWSGKNEIAYSARMGRNYTIGITDMTGQNPPRNVVSAAGDWEGPSWAPDDRHVVCSRSQGGASTLYVVDTWTGKTRQLLNVRHSCTMPAWSGIIGK